MWKVALVQKRRGSHSMTSLAATVVTSCRGISALARMSWALLDPCWMLVRMSVVPPAVVMILSEDPADSMEATTALPEFTPFLFWWVLMCFARWSLRMKRFEHSGQTNFFSPAKDKRGVWTKRGWNMPTVWEKSLWLWHWQTVRFNHNRRTSGYRGWAHRRATWRTVHTHTHSQWRVAI